MKNLRLYVEYVKTFFWLLFYGVVKVSSIDTSNGLITVMEKRGVRLGLDKNHWVGSSSYPRPIVKMELVDKDSYKGLKITYRLSSFEAGMITDTREYLSYGQVRIYVQHEPYHGTHYFIVGRNKDGTFWVATWRRVQGPFDKVEAEIDWGIRAVRYGKSATCTVSELAQYTLDHTAPIKFIYTAF
jgi:hypothetical protein